MEQNERFCQACGMPISERDVNIASEQYCAWCSDAEGNLKSWARPLMAWLSFSTHGKKSALKKHGSGQNVISRQCPPGLIKRTSDLS